MIQIIITIEEKSGEMKAMAEMLCKHETPHEIKLGDAVIDGIPKILSGNGCTKPDKITDILFDRPKPI